MKQLYDEVSLACSKLTTRKYSTSFSMGILFLDKPFRGAIYSIYGFVRLADEIVDSFHDFDKRYLLDKFRQDTYEAIDQKIALNPILNSFQKVVHECKIEGDLVDAFLDSMQMDLELVTTDHESYEQYIYGSAEAVGLMCLHVFVQGDKGLYRELKPFARKLGAAFQKVNFLRDLKDDNAQLGRMYFPNINVSRLTDHEKRQIEMEIEEDFSRALMGIRKLPSGSRNGVYLAYYYYSILLKKIKRCPSKTIMNQRIRISNAEKIYLMVKSNIRHQLNMI